MQHTLVALVEDKPGVLNRIASLFRRRAFNIESLTVGHTEQPHVSRMTIVVDGANTAVHMVEANLTKLINVIDLKDVTDHDTIMRDLALIKVRSDSAGRAEIAQLAETFRAQIIDVAHDSLVLEITGGEDKIDGLVELLRPKGIIEMVRTGRVAMLRGNQSERKLAAARQRRANGTNGHASASEVSGSV